MNTVILIICVITLIAIDIAVMAQINSNRRKQEFTRIDKEFQEKKLELDKLLTDYEELIHNRMTSLDFDYNSFQCEVNEKKKEDQQQLDFLRNAVKGINEQINEGKMLESEKRAHCLIFSETDQSDIDYLLTIQNTLTNKTIVPKIIWSGYLINAFNTMYKTQFGAKDPKNAIYCIENLDSKEIYIGRTVNVHDRWTEHIKTSLGVGGTAPASIHRAMYDNWDRFSFRVLEENIPVNKIKEREKFYIDFYQSNIYGYNQNRGG